MMQRHIDIKNSLVTVVSYYLQEDVESFMKKEDETAESVLKKLDEQHNKYKFMEYNLNTKRARYTCFSKFHFSVGPCLAFFLTK